MKLLSTVTAARAPRTKGARRVALIYAAILSVMAVAQLYTFDHFLELILTFGLPGQAATSYFFAAFLVTCEVLALPFLLRMPLSPAFRWVSMILGWIVAGLWIVLTIGLFSQGAVGNVGFLGTVFEVVPSWWTVCISLMFGFLAAWSSWGLWPRYNRKQEMRNT